MDERIHRYLDGDLPWEELGAHERAEALRFERAVEELRRDGETPPLRDVSGGVMERVEALAAVGRGAADTARDAVEPADSALERVLRWLFGRREFSLTLRPVYAVAVIALLAGAAALWSDGGDAAPLDRSPASIAERSDRARVYVRFQLTVPDARSVKLAGSFSDWSPDIDLRRMSDGRWAALVPLSPGVHDYAFQVDEERWIPDPSAPKVADGFGGFNSRLSLVLANS